jgi:hypothetical protein
VDIALDEPFRRRRRPLAPELVDEAGVGDDFVRVQQQHS